MIGKLKLPNIRYTRESIYNDDDYDDNDDEMIISCSTIIFFLFLKKRYNATPLSTYIHLKGYFKKGNQLHTTYLWLKTSKTLLLSKGGLIKPDTIPVDIEQQNPSVSQNRQHEDPEKEFTERSTKAQIKSFSKTSVGFP